MPRHAVIGIAGKARSGKDTVAEFIIAQIGGYRYSFVDPIRAMLRAGFNIDLNEKYWQDRKEEEIPILGKSPRQLMQTLGTEWGRQLVNPNLWLILANQHLLRRGPGMVIPDIRFDNEAEWVRAVGGRVIHLHRPGAQQVNAHVSEAGVTPLAEELVIENSGTLDELQAKIRSVFE